MRAAGLVGAAMLFACSRGRPGETGRSRYSPARNNKPAEYVGSATCQTCHEDIFNAFQKNPHQVVETDKKRGFETKACEAATVRAASTPNRYPPRISDNPPS